MIHFRYRRTIRLKQENFSCNNKTNYARRHKFITHKKNCCQVFSRSCNDQPLFVNVDPFTTIFSFDLEHSYMVINTGWVHETFYKTRRVLQGISKQKLTLLSSPAPLSLYWKQRQTSTCIKHESPRSPKVEFSAFRPSRLHLSNPERLLY